MAKLNMSPEQIAKLVAAAEKQREYRKKRSTREDVKEKAKAYRADRNLQLLAYRDAFAYLLEHDLISDEVYEKLRANVETLSIYEEEHQD